MDDDLAFATALEQAALVRSRQVSPVELVDGYLARIEEQNPALGAYLTVAAAEAREAARAAEARVAPDAELPPFLGVPISVKDLADTAGIRSTWGTATWRDRVPAADDEVVARIKRAGFVVLGKTNTPEFGCRATTESPAYPTARNPWDPRRHAGGSSGGAAAALATGLCPISHGTDGGGSIRTPAAWCGVLGLKPSRGRVSFSPRAQAWASVIGPLARDVRDAAALLDVMAGYASGDAWWAPPPARPFLEEAGVPPGRLRIAWTTRHPVDDAGTEQAWRVAVESTAALLGELGHEVVEAAPPTIDMMGAALVTVAGMVPVDLPPRDTLDPVMRTMLDLAEHTSALDRGRAEVQLHAEIRHVCRFFERFDVLLTPALAGGPPLVGERLMDEVDFAGLMRLTRTIGYTPQWNQTGQPAVALPAGFDDAGLPVAVQLVGRPADEATLLRLAAQLEDARPWRGYRPSSPSATA